MSSGGGGGGGRGSVVFGCGRGHVGILNHVVRVRHVVDSSRSGRWRRLAVVAAVQERRRVLGRRRLLVRDERWLVLLWQLIRYIWLLLVSLLCQRLLLVSLLQRQLLLFLLVVLVLLWLLVVFGGVNVVAALGHDSVEPVVAVGRIVDRPYGTVGLHQTVRSFDHVALPVLPLALQVTSVQVLDAVIEMIVGLAL